jgi:hypothetical protein
MAHRTVFLFSCVLVIEPTSLTRSVEHDIKCGMGCVEEHLSALYCMVTHFRY